MTDEPPDVRFPRGTSPRTWKATTPGMWAWLTQRVAAIALVPLIALHVFWPYRAITQLLLLTLVVFHGLLGIRVLMIDIGVGARYEKVALGVAAAAGLALLLLLGQRLL